uniref:Glycosyl transferase n=1 Tax=consortium cosmid clone pGZ1 TaxID=397422 RepID=Q0MX73_9BACT|nr:glycosyl transferase [consortium cosmid clone pGZ1]
MTLGSIARADAATGSRARRLAWEQADHILCVRLDNLGDVLMTTPAMRALKQARASRRLTLLGSGAGVRAAAFVPEIDATIRYEAPWVKNGRACASELDRTAIEVIAAHRFDAAVIFTAYSQSPIAAALLCLMAGIPLRLAHCRENPYLLLSDWVPETEPAQQVRHETQRQLDLVSAVAPAPRDLRLSFSIPAHERASLARKLAEAGIDPSGEYIVVHPGASAPSRRYPAERYAQAVRELASCQPRPIVVTGGADEAPICAQVAAVHGVDPGVRAFDGVRRRAAMLDGMHRRVPTTSCTRVLDLAGCLTLGELGALIEGAGVLVSNNTGPVHIAAALGTPVVDLYALTNPQHRPWRVASRVLNRDVPCRNCYKSVCPNATQACLSGVPASEVVEATLELLDLRERAAVRIERAPFAGRRSIARKAADPGEARPWSRGI